MLSWSVFFFQAEDGIRDLVRSRGLGDVYKRQLHEEEDARRTAPGPRGHHDQRVAHRAVGHPGPALLDACLLYTSDAADDLLCVDLGGRRIIKKKKLHEFYHTHHFIDAYYQYIAIIHDLHSTLLILTTHTTQVDDIRDPDASLAR